MREISAGGPGRADALRRLIAFAERTDDANLCLRSALILKECQEPGHSHRIFEIATRKWPSNANLLNEKLQLERLHHQSHRANATFIDFARSGLNPNLVMRDAVAALMNSTRDAKHMSPELVAAMMSVVAASRNDFLRSTIEYIFRNFSDLSRTFENLAFSHFSDIHEVYDRLERLIIDRRPGCLLRLGDGEGAALQNSLHASKMSESNLKHFTERWFGSSDPATYARVSDIAREIRERIGEADVIGIPPLGWIEKELRLRHTQIYVNCLEASRACFEKKSPEALVADVSISVQMEQHGLVSRLIKKAGAVSVVGSRRDLPKLIESKLRIKVNSQVLIPPPASDQEARPGEMQKGTHLQNFDAIRASLNVQYPGEVFLVSGGFLGKLYGLDIKRRGGIALDIGFLGDLWVDFRSRPESSISRNNPLAL